MFGKLTVFAFCSISLSCASSCEAMGNGSSPGPDFVEDLYDNVCPFDLAQDKRGTDDFAQVFSLVECACLTEGCKHHDAEFKF